MQNVGLKKDYPAGDTTVHALKGIDLRDSETGLKMLYSKGIPLKVTGIIRPSEDATSTMLSAGIAYTPDLTKTAPVRRLDAE